MNPFSGGLQGPSFFGNPRSPVLNDLVGQMRTFRAANQMLSDGIRQNLSQNLGMPFGLPGLNFFDPFGFDPFGYGPPPGPPQIGGPFAQNQPDSNVDVRQEGSGTSGDEEDGQYKQAYEDLLDQMEEQEEPSRSSAAKGLTKTDLDKAYKAGLISADDYTQGLIDYGLSPEDASLRSSIYGPEGEANRKSGRSTGLNLTDLRKGFKLGRISYEEYITELTTNKSKTRKEAEEMARSDMGLEGNFNKALQVSPGKRNEWRQLYNARNKKRAPLKKPTPDQKRYADARKWAQEFKKDSENNGTLDGYLAYAYGKLANKLDPDSAKESLNTQPSVYSVAYKDAFEGKKGYVSKEKPAFKNPRLEEVYRKYKAAGGKAGPKTWYAASRGDQKAAKEVGSQGLELGVRGAPITKQNKKNLVDLGGRSFVNDENQKAFTAYKKSGGKLGPKTWWKEIGSKRKKAS